MLKSHKQLDHIKMYANDATKTWAQGRLSLAPSIRSQWANVALTSKKSKVVPHLITSTGLRADPGFLAVSPQ